MKHYEYRASILCVCFCLVACGKAPAIPGEPAPSSKPEPTREAAVALLERLCQAVEAGDLKAAAAYMRTPADMSERKMLKHVADRLIPREFSRAGLAVLVEKGEWEQMPDTDKVHYFPQWKLQAKDCWRLRMRPAEVAFYWNGQTFEIIRIDDIAHLGRK